MMYLQASYEVVLEYLIIIMTLLCATGVLCYCGSVYPTGPLES